MKINFKNVKAYGIEIYEAACLKRNLMNLKSVLGVTYKDILCSAKGLYAAFSDGSISRPSISTVTRVVGSPRTLLTRVTPLTECLCNVFGGASAQDLIKDRALTPNEKTYITKTLTEICETVSDKIGEIDASSAVTTIHIIPDEYDHTALEIYNQIARRIDKNDRDLLRELWKTRLHSPKNVVLLNTDIVMEAARNYTGELAGDYTPVKVGLVDPDRVEQIKKGREKITKKVLA